MVQRRQQASYCQRKRELSRFGVEGEKAHRQDEDEREDRDTLIPTQDAGREPHHLAEEEAAERGRGGYKPAGEQEVPVSLGRGRRAHGHLRFCGLSNVRRRTLS